MDTLDAVDVFAALAHATRVQALRAIIARSPAGMPAGDVARSIGVPQNTMSTHLAILSRAGLISSERRSRLIIYRAELGQIRDVTTFLVNDCCDGRPELCEPLVAALNPVCCTLGDGKNAC